MENSQATALNTQGQGPSLTELFCCPRGRASLTQSTQALVLEGQPAPARVPKECTLHPRPPLVLSGAPETRLALFSFRPDLTGQEALIVCIMLHC
jgi:hypothetical protein